MYVLETTNATEESRYLVVFVDISGVVDRVARSKGCLAY